MASLRTQVLVCLVVVGCLATLAASLPAPQEEEGYSPLDVQSSYLGPYAPHSSESDETSNESDDSGEASIPVVEKRSAEDSKDNPKIEPVNKNGQTRPWSPPPAHQTSTQDKKEKRSAEETKETPKPGYTTASTSTSKDALAKPVESLNTDKKQKRETEQKDKQPVAPATVPTTGIPSKVNTPSLTRPAIRPAVRPQPATTSDKKEKRGTEAVKEDSKDAATPLQAAKPNIKTERPHSEDKKEKRSAEEGTKLPETKPWQPKPEVTTEEVKTTRLVPAPYIPARHD